MTTAIEVENLGKQYRIGNHAPYARFTELLVGAAKAPFSYARQKLAAKQATEDDPAGQPPPERTFWALRNVNFKIEQGQIVGVIGRNGAGKSTLLKLLSRITEPSEGRIRYRGRVGSLLEVGTGFHPELTGRDNIYLNGAILGMTRSEIRKKFDEIVAFSEVEKFLDTAVKHYSSGMYMRLAFAVAAHLEPEILLVDEVLAVGDAEFQKKCLGKMGEVAKGGRTVLFVSHNIEAIAHLTQKCIYLQKGELLGFESTSKMVKKYMEMADEQANENLSNIEYFRRDSNKISPIHITGIKVASVGENSINALQSQELIISLNVKASEYISSLCVNIAVHNESGVRVVNIFSLDSHSYIDLGKGRHCIEMSIPQCPLIPGKYKIDVGLNRSPYSSAYEVILGYPIRVPGALEEIKYWSQRPWGLIHLKNVRWAVK